MNGCMKGETMPKDALAFLYEVAHAAGEVLSRYYHGRFQIDDKNPYEGSIDIVTDADRASEDLIVQAIGKNFPDDDILTEETQIALKGSPRMWVVDPLDGTVNFAHRIPIFTISIALVDEGELAAGVVYDPLRRELFAAVRNGGAFLNGNPIRVSVADRLNRSIVGTGFPYDRAVSPDNNLAEFCSVVPRVQGIRRGGSAALDLAYVSSGRLDGFWEPKLKPWDMAAGMLLVKEAGGVVTDRAGKPTDMYTSFVVASNGGIHEQLLALIQRPGEDVRS
jgi:myo-inositol-1(or 4)-monophosphatase